jgi:hypothetical protein
MSKPQRARDLASDFRVVVEVDGHPVGFLDLDVDRLWPLIQHRGGNGPAVEWINPDRYSAAVRAAVGRKMRERLQTRLLPILGDEIVKAQLDVENRALRAEAAAQAFGRSKAEIQALTKEAKRSPAEFDAFFWDYLLSEKETKNLKKEFKSSKRGR